MTIELFGLARALAGTPTIELTLAEPATLATLVEALGSAYPELIGEVIAASRDAFVEPNYLLLDGRRAVMAGELITSADRPCILFLASGG